MIRASIAQFHEMLDIVPPSKPILLIGDTGIGKTTIVKRWADAREQYFAYVPCMSTAETVNLTGIPDVSGDHTVYKPMEWYKPGVITTLLLDEINRNEYIINALMELAVDQHIGSVQLAPGSRVIAAMNPSYDNMYMVKELEMSHMTRFCVVELAPTVEEWVDYARDEGVHPAICNFIDKHPTALDPEPDGTSRASRRFYTNMDATRRGWYTLSEAIYNAERTGKLDPFKNDGAKDLLSLLVTGYVGPANSNKFCSYYFTTTYGKVKIDNDILTAVEVMEASDTRWKKELPTQIERMCNEHSSDAVDLLNSIVRLIDSKIGLLYNETTCKITTKGLAYSINFYKLMSSCTPELVSQLYFNQIKPTKQKAGETITWIDVMIAGCPETATLLKRVRSSSLQKNQDSEVNEHAYG